MPFYEKNGDEITTIYDIHGKKSLKVDPHVTLITDAQDGSYMFSYMDICDVVFERSNLNNSNFEKSDLYKIGFKYIWLRNGIFDTTTLENVKFTGVYFTRFNINKTLFTDCDYKGGLVICNSEINETTIQNVRDDITFRDCDINDVEICKCKGQQNTSGVSIKIVNSKINNSLLEDMNIDDITIDFGSIKDLEFKNVRCSGFMKVKKSDIRKVEWKNTVVEDLILEDCKYDKNNLPFYNKIQVKGGKVLMKERRDGETIVEDLHRVLQEGSRGIFVEEIVECVGGKGEVNCYPGYPTRKCHSIAYFVSINGAAAVGKKGHINFRGIMRRFKGHMSKACYGITKRAVIISNDWNTEEYEKYHIYIEQLRKTGVIIEAYFIGGRGSMKLMDS